jgi:voltage-gated potassium channel
VDIGLMTLISLNVLAVILQSVPTLDARFHEYFQAFEIFSVAIFTLEFALRLWVCIERPEYGRRGPMMGRMRYSLTPMALIDLFAILPFYLSALGGLDLRFLRVVRLIRLLKLARYSIAMQALLDALRAEADKLAAGFVLLFVLFVLAASGIHLLERDVQPEAFGSIPDAMWWAMATLTTVGYGDVVPITPWGRVFGGCITLIGVGMVALPAGIIASGFSERLRQPVDYNALLDIVLDPRAPMAERRRAARSLGDGLQLNRYHQNRLLQLILSESAAAQRPKKSC